MDEAVEFVTRAAVLGGPELARAVGDYVVQTFFNGDYDEFSRPSRSKPVSFRAFAARADLPFSAGTICTLVRISRQLRELPAEVAQALPLSHHRALLPLREAALKVELGAAACCGKWTRQRLEHEVRALLPDTRVGRKPRGLLVRAERHVATAAAEAREGLDKSRELSRMSLSELQCLLRSMEASRTTLHEVCSRLREVIDVRGRSFPEDTESIGLAEIPDTNA